MRVNLDNAYDLEHEKLGTSAVKQKHPFDLSAIDEPYGKGDLVWPMNKSWCKGICPKLQPKWLGPMLEVERLNNVLY